MRQSDLFKQPKRPWNAGRLIGPKAPLKPKHIWAIRQQLKVAKRVRDLAMFNSALDAKLRACDLVRLRVCDVAPGGALRQRSIVIQQKTGRPVPFEITEPARDAIAAWLKVRGEREDHWLFPSRSRPGQHIGTRQYERARRSVGSDDRLGTAGLRDPQPQAYEGVARLQQDRQPSGLSAPARPQEAGEHRQVPRYRGGRCSRDVRTDRPVTHGRAQKRARPSSPNGREQTVEPKLPPDTDPAGRTGGQNADPKDAAAGDLWRKADPGRRGLTGRKPGALDPLPAQHASTQCAAGHRLAR